MSEHEAEQEAERRWGQLGVAFYARGIAHVGELFPGGFALDIKGSGPTFEDAFAAVDAKRDQGSA